MKVSEACARVGVLDYGMILFSSLKNLWLFVNVCFFPAFCWHINQCFDVFLVFSSRLPCRPYALRTKS